MRALRPLRIHGALVALAACLASAPLAAQIVPAVQVEVLALSPEPGERIPENAVMVAASFIDRGSQLDPGSIRISVDGRDVTPEAELSAEVAIWRPRIPLPPGPHRVLVTAQTRGGTSVTPASWAFTVESAGESAAAQLIYRRPPNKPPRTPRRICRPMPDPTERAALFATAWTSPSRRPPRGPVDPSRRSDNPPFDPGTRCADGCALASSCVLPARAVNFS